MDDPLVPESLKGNAKYLVYGGVGSALLFVVITIIMTVVYGSKKGHPAWFVLALAMLGILLTTCTLLNWLRQNTVEEKLKYVATAQLLLLVLLSIAAMIDILRKEVTCDPCVQVPTACDLAVNLAIGSSPCAAGQQITNCGSFSPNACFQSAGWNSPGNGSLSIVYLNIQEDAPALQNEHSVLSTVASAAAPAVASVASLLGAPLAAPATAEPIELDAAVDDVVASLVDAETEMEADATEEEEAMDAADTAKALAEAEAASAAAEERLQEIADAAALKADPVNAHPRARKHALGL